jgi:hypothetical protein
MFRINKKSHLILVKTKKETLNIFLIKKAKEKLKRTKRVFLTQKYEDKV